MRALLAFLTEDCGGGHPEICGYAPRTGQEEDAGTPDANIEQEP